VTADKMTELLREVRPSEHASPEAICEALIVALRVESPAELKQLSQRFEDVGMKALAALCRTLVNRRNAH